MAAIPGAAGLYPEREQPREGFLDRMLIAVQYAAGRMLSSRRRLWRIDPCRFDPHLVDLCADAVREATGHAPRLPSGPLHDAVEMARVMPSVMMFARSTNGLSHCKEEDTPEADLRVTIDTFLRLVDKTVAAVAANS